MFSELAPGYLFPMTATGGRDRYSHAAPLSAKQVGVIEKRGAGGRTHAVFSQAGVLHLLFAIALVLAVHSIPVGEMALEHHGSVPVAK